MLSSAAAAGRLRAGAGTGWCFAWSRRRFVAASPNPFSPKKRRPGDCHGRSRLLVNSPNASGNASHGRRASHGRGSTLTISGVSSTIVTLVELFSLAFSLSTALLNHLIQLLMCVTVLVCPATGGQCCVSVENVSIDEHTSTEQTCGHCCCVDTESQHQDRIPTDCPNQCHHCFCAGALPPGFQAPEIPTASDLAVSFATYDVGIVQPKVDRWAVSHRVKPPSGRALLTSYCMLRL